MSFHFLEKKYKFRVTPGQEADYGGHGVEAFIYLLLTPVTICWEGKKAWLIIWVRGNL